MKNKDEIIKYIITDLEENINESQELIFTLVSDALHTKTVDELIDFFQLEIEK